MDDFPLTLQLAGSQEQRRPQGRRAASLPDGLPDDQIRHSRLVFQGDEGDALGGRRALPDQDDPGDADGLSIRPISQFRPPELPRSRSTPAQKFQRMPLQRQPDRLVIGQHFLGRRHGGQGTGD